MNAPRPPRFLRRMPLLVVALFAAGMVGALYAGVPLATVPLFVAGSLLLAWIINDASDEADRFQGLVARWQERVDELEDVANGGSLTGLGNQRRFEMDFWRALARFHRRAEPFAAAILELSDALRSNRQLTPAVLTRVAQIVGGVTRTEDSVCRLDRQTLVVLLSGTRENGAERFVERVRIEISGHTFNVDGFTVYVTVYGGVAEWRHGMKSVAELLSAAEADLRRFRVEYKRDSAFFEADRASSR